MMEKSLSGELDSFLAPFSFLSKLTFRHSGLDTTKFDSTTLVTVPNVNRKGFWEANVDDAAVGNQTLGLQGRTAILDTGEKKNCKHSFVVMTNYWISLGTTLAIIPTQDAITIHQQIPGATFDGTSTFTVPCNTATVVSFTFGGRAFAIDPRDLAFIPVDAANAQTGDCVSGISAGNFGGPTQWLVRLFFLNFV